MAADDRKKAVWDEVGLTEEEYGFIRETLGREPNYLELGLFGLMWSEHCSYKSSRRILSQLPTEGDRVLQGPGENAGVVDVGEGWAAAFKIESHNHPSAIEPYQGAATGVGGIIRDIFTMGARPIALMDPLKFGHLDKARNRFLFGGVVSGIGGYGNCVGIPTVGGEVFFSDSYDSNPLVNVLCLGVMPAEKLTLGYATGEGNPVLLVGASTGRDGIHGASLLASQEFAEEGEDQRPAVQVGDPFMEKLLIEACLELLETDAVVGLQDLGAAGLTSSLSETASRAGTGVTIDVSRVPRREEGMTPYEVMLSESQERMLVIVKAGREDEVEGLFVKWGLNSTVIGHVTGDGMLRVRDGGDVVAEVPARALADDAPAYERPYASPDDIEGRWALDLDEVPVPGDLGEVLEDLLSSPNIASKEWIYSQYDHMVRTNTTVLPGSDGAVLRLKGTGRALALATDSAPRYCYLDPRRGTELATAEAARNVVCSGAEPVAVTNCLNFGNPEKPETMWAFREAVAGMATVCRALNMPVTGGNVSFYNETAGKPVYPTPTMGVLGVLKDAGRACTQWFKDEGDVIALLGPFQAELGGSEYLDRWHHRVAGRPAPLDLELEAAVQGVCLEGIRAGYIKSAHDCADGGLGVALTECCFGEPARQPRASSGDRHANASALGAEIQLVREDYGSLRPDALLFGEAPSRILVTVSHSDLPELQRSAADYGAPVTVIGTVAATGRLKVEAGQRSDHSERLAIIDWTTLIDRPVEQLRAAWSDAIPALVGDIEEPSIGRGPA